ncbi:hypothetical protein FHR95_001794 [Halomonas fontilapidosi]|uniref:Uncharacterized protein n=1 Tax=Halomonas fontilapidosi TaxID=616675 RepID=A0A7W5GYC9_9GAMM|nr:hypothetical protein [Halomonas fontilapidosi]
MHTPQTATQAIPFASDLFASDLFACHQRGFASRNQTSR